MTHDRTPPSPNGTFFFTLGLRDRAGRGLTDHIDQLRAAYALTLHDMPVHTDAIVVLPDHLHAIWTEPGPHRFAQRWHRFKTRFARAVAGNAAGEVWHRQLHVHAIGTADQMARAMDYCRTNPVQHGLVTNAADWPYSSFAKSAAHLAA